MPPRSGPRTTRPSAFLGMRARYPRASSTVACRRHTVMHRITYRPPGSGYSRQLSGKVCRRCPAQNMRFPWRPPIHHAFSGWIRYPPRHRAPRPPHTPRRRGDVSIPGRPAEAPRSIRSWLPAGTAGTTTHRYPTPAVARASPNTQHLHCLPHGVSAGSHHLDQHRLGRNPASDRPPSRHDLVLEPVDDLVDQPLTAYRLQFFALFSRIASRFMGIIHEVE